MCEDPMSEEEEKRKAEADAEEQLRKKYGGLPKTNPLISHSLKSGRQFFDSGDYVLEQQHQHQQPPQPQAEPERQHGHALQLPFAYNHKRAASGSDGVPTKPPTLDSRGGGGGSNSRRGSLIATTK